MRLKEINIKKIVIVLGFTVIFVGCGIIQGSEGYTFSKLRTLNRCIEKVYLGELNKENLNEGIYRGYVEGLENPVSTYLDETEYKANLANEVGEEIGTGLTYTWGLDGNHLVIVDVVKDSPAARVGLEVGDQIIQVDDVKVIYSNQNELANILNSSREGDINTYIVRKKSNTEAGKEITVTIEKSLIEKESFKTDIIDDIGYIKLQNIKSGTSDELKSQINKFKTQGINKIVLDIRDLYSNNLEEIVKVCDLFMDEDIAFKIKNKSGEMKAYKTSTPKLEIQATILMNTGTVGMVEALPAALKGKIPLIGTDTAGRGYLSKLFALEDGTGVRLATGILYTANNIELTNEGVAVDEEVTQTLDSLIELVSEGTMSYSSDMQLQSAIKKLQ